MLDQGPSQPSAEDPWHDQLYRALIAYKDAVIAENETSNTDVASAQIDQMILELKLDATSAEGQRSAFSATRGILERHLGIAVNPDRDIELRERVRAEEALPLLPVLSGKSKPVVQADAPKLVLPKRRLLDVEVIAIYW